MSQDFLLNFEHQYFIDISAVPNFQTPVYTRMAAGFKSVDVATDEETDDTAYLDGDGGTTTTVTGNTIGFEFTGDLDNDDPVHKYIISKLATYGTARVTSFKWQLPAPTGFTTGYVFEGPATLLDISPVSGDANAKSEISVTVRFNGTPKVTAPTP